MRIWQTNLKDARRRLSRRTTVSQGVRSDRNRYEHSHCCAYPQECLTLRTLRTWGKTYCGKLIGDAAERTFEIARILPALLRILRQAAFNHPRQCHWADRLQRPDWQRLRCQY